jgi:hypothetical protein
MIELDPGPEVAELRDAHQAFAAVRFGGARGLFLSNRLICRDFRPENVALCGN